MGILNKHSFYFCNTIFVMLETGTAYRNISVISNDYVMYIIQSIILYVFGTVFLSTD